MIIAFFTTIGYAFPSDIQPNFDSFSDIFLKLYGTSRCYSRETNMISWYKLSYLSAFEHNSTAYYIDSSGRVEMRIIKLMMPNESLLIVVRLQVKTHTITKRNKYFTDRSFSASHIFVSNFLNCSLFLYHVQFIPSLVQHGMTITENMSEHTRPIHVMNDAWMVLALCRANPSLIPPPAAAASITWLDTASAWCWLIASIKRHRRSTTVCPMLL